MKNILIITCVFLVIFFNRVQAQITFEKTFGTTGDNSANDVRLTSDGGYIIVGTAGFTTSSGDIFLIKTNAGGDTIWTRMIGGTGIENGNSVQPTADGGYIIAGSTTSGAGGTDAYLVKTDVNGYVSWSKTYGTTSNDAAYGVVQTADGGFVFSGTEKQAGLNGNAHLVKVDASGNMMWSKTFGNSTRKNFAYTLEQTADHGFIIGGWENLDLGINDDFCLIKTDSNGAKQWYRSYGTAGHEQNYSVHQTSDGGFIIAGITFSSSLIDVNVVKTDANGNLVWTKNIGGSGEDDAYAVTATSDGGFVFCGTTSSFGLNHAAYLAKTSASGNLLWSKAMNGTGWDGFFAIQEASDGGLILAGVKGETYGVSGSLYLVKTDANGNSGCNMSVTSSAFTPSILVGTPIATGTSTQMVNTIIPTVTSGTSMSTICSSCLPATTMPSGGVSICSGTSLMITANSGNGISYQWYRNGNAISGATNQIYSTRKSGIYYVNENSPGCSSNSPTITVTVWPTPAATIMPLGNLDICQTGSVNLQANSGAGLTYQWKKGNNNIPGATNQIYTAALKGNYMVIVTSSNGCSKSSAAIQVTKSCKENFSQDLGFSTVLDCYPNPSAGVFTIDLKLDDSRDIQAVIEIFNSYDQRVYVQEAAVANGELKRIIDVTRNLPGGYYLVRVTAGNATFSQRLIIEQ